MKKRYSNWKLRRELKKKGINIDKTAIISKDNTYGGLNNIHDRTTFIGSIGYGSYICINCEIHGSVGKYTCIADNVKTIIGTHPLKDYVSIHPSFYSVDPLNAFTYVDKQLFEERKFVKDQDYIVIGNDVWIGTNVNIMQGVTIGDGAVIGANALVTKDVPPYAIVAGIPAKIIKYRFTEEQREFLLKFKWWDKSPEWIKEHHEEFLNIEEFMKKYNK